MDCDNKKTTAIYQNKEIVEKIKKKTDGIHSPKLLKAGVEFIKENKDQPFFLFLSHSMPHIPVATSEKFTGKSEHGPYGDAVEEIDESLGRIVNTLKILGIEKNTLIIFTSDNGTAITAKTKGVERGPHVINIIAGAGVKKRGATDELTDFADIAPTLADYAGAKLPKSKTFDGISLRPFLTGETDETKEFIYGFISTSQIVRTKNYMLEVVNPMLGMPKGRFYYTAEHRFGKGYQLVNDDPKHAKERERFTKFLKDFPPITENHPYWQTKRGKRFLKEYTTQKSIEKHLYNHRDYKFYDEGRD